MKTIICSHGFGVRADSLGMFPEIAAAFPDDDFRMFDYSIVAPNGDTTFRSLPEQGEVLQAQIDATDGEIVLLCHSQGCLIPGFADVSRVSKVILLAPPDSITKETILARLRMREGSVIIPVGMSKLPRSDGTTSYIPTDYLESVEAVKPLEVYQRISNTKPTVIIRATHDEIIGLTKVDEIKNAEHIDIASDHNFTGDNRQKLIDKLRLVL